MEKKYFTSESVTEGHPDKVCDKISDNILDAILKEDKEARVACETCVTEQYVHVMGEITTKANVDYDNVIRNTIKEIGYTKKEYGFDYQNVEIKNLIHTQSPDIALGVNNSYEAKNGEADPFDIGAGDQGMVFGYACDETNILMPLGYYLATKLSKRLTYVRKSGLLAYLRPDGKTQVTVEYIDDVPSRVDCVVVSCQHDENVSQEQIRKDIIKYVILNEISQDLIDDKTKIYINPTGRFVIGGPLGDSGLTGRKIIVDTYGGYSRHGGGAFSGKDPTKVDRSASYAARYAAKNIVASGLAKKCEVQISYAIGVAKPLSINVNTFGTSEISNEAFEKCLRELCDFRPAAIINYFNLRTPIYSELSAYGHFGREELNVKWEDTDLSLKIKEYFK